MPSDKFTPTEATWYIHGASCLSVDDTFENQHSYAFVTKAYTYNADNPTYRYI